MPTERELIDALCRLHLGWSKDIAGDQDDYRAATNIVQSHAAQVRGQIEERRIGDAINDALYKTPYDGKRNIPCLSDEQRIAAARAAIAAMR